MVFPLVGLVLLPVIRLLAFAADCDPNFMLGGFFSILGFLANLWTFRGTLRRVFRVF